MVTLNKAKINEGDTAKYEKVQLKTVWLLKVKLVYRIYCNGLKYLTIELAKFTSSMKDRIQEIKENPLPYLLAIVSYIHTYKSSFIIFTYWHPINVLKYNFMSLFQLKSLDVFNSLNWSLKQGIAY